MYFVQRVLFQGAYLNCVVIYDNLKVADELWRMEGLKPPV